MTKPIIEVSSLSKCYTIGAKESYDSLREEIMQTVTAPFRRLARFSKPQTATTMPSDTTLWALKDVSFAVQEGDVIGIIGRNGAGKSTLLKILSRITEPTSGRISMRGRVASLLEVGTGFHPELTGRENIFLNGALLGMTRQEIKAKFDEIVAFAEIDKFIDTPVKRYSSGMYVRLAFAVAAHMEPEILIIDEVLAVGDAQFQKKCLGRMKEVGKEGRTVLFVSHNLAAVTSLCNRAVMLKNGSVSCEGDVQTVVEHYLKETEDEGVQDGLITNNTPRTGTGAIRLRKIELRNMNGEIMSSIHLGQQFRILLTIEVLELIKDEIMAIVYISKKNGNRFGLSYNTWGNQSGWNLSKGCYKVALDIDVVLLPHHEYVFDVGIHNSNGTVTFDFVEQTFTFSVLSVSQDGKDLYPWANSHAFIRVNSRWSKPELEA